MKTVLILGATGQVGLELLQLTLEHPDISKVVAPTRTPLPKHDKLENPIIDFDDLPQDAPWWRADFACCALGTTLRRAKSKAGFSRVDHDYVLAAAKLAHRAGTPTFCLVSSLAANPTSRLFYLSVKGETETDLTALGFNSLTILRPSLLIGGARSLERPLEAIGLFIGKHLSALFPRHYHAVSTQAVAHTLLQAGFAAQSGRHIIESEYILS